MNQKLHRYSLPLQIVNLKNYEEKSYENEKNDYFFESDYFCAGLRGMCGKAFNKE